MKCSDCPAFELDAKYSPLTIEETLRQYEAEMQKRFGKLGRCAIFNSPVRERTTTNCDKDDYLEGEIHKCINRIAIIEKVQKHIEDRRVRCGQDHVLDVEEQ